MFKALTKTKTKTIDLDSDLEQNKKDKKYDYDDPKMYNERKAESDRIKEKFPDRIPILVRRSKNTDIPAIDKNKYLVPGDLSVGQFIFVIRKRIQLSQEKAIFLFIGENSVIPPTAELMINIYEKYKSIDGFLRFEYSGENTFGQPQ